MMTTHLFKGSHPSRAVAEPAKLIAPLKLAWTTQYARPPLAYGGRVYFGGKQIVCRREATGVEVWSVSSNTRGHFGTSARAVHEGRLLVDNGRGAIKLLSCSDGAVVLEFALPAAADPVIVGNVLVAHGYGEDSIYGADLTNGRILWKYSLQSIPGTDTLLSCVFSASPKAAFVGRRDGRIHAISLEDGHELWVASVAHLKSPTPEGETHGYPVGFTQVFGELLIIRLWGFWVVALSTNNGQIVWSRKTSHTIADGQLYGDRYYVSQYGGWYSILDARNGELVLEADLNATIPIKRRPVYELFPILVSETHIFAGIDPGQLAAFDRDTGKCVWFHQVKDGSSYQKQTYFMSVNGRLFFADMGNRLYCYEEIKGKGVEMEVDEEGQHIAFDVLEIHEECQIISTPPYHTSHREGGVLHRIKSFWSAEGSGGPITVLRCRSGEATFLLAARSEKKGKGPFEWGEGYLWVPTVEDGDRLLKAIRVAFGAGRGKAKKGSGVKPPTPLGLVFLGEGVDEHGSGQGMWTHTKWTGKDGSPEFYVKWSLKETRGVIAEKDETYRKDLIKLFESLVVRS